MLLPIRISAIHNYIDVLSKREVKLQELSALCQIFNIPIQDICEYPNAATSDLELSRLTSRKNAKHLTVKHLINPFCEGRYYCYYFRPKHSISINQTTASNPSHTGNLICPKLRNWLP